MSDNAALTRLMSGRSRRNNQNINVFLFFKLFWLWHTLSFKSSPGKRDLMSERCKPQFMVRFCVSQFNDSANNKLTYWKKKMMIIIIIIIITNNHNNYNDDDNTTTTNNSNNFNSVLINRLMFTCSIALLPHLFQKGNCLFSPIMKRH